MKITISVFKAESGDEHFPPRDLLAFRDWLHKQINKIPEEYRNDANIEIDATSFYDSAMTEIEISYVREETENEKKSRELNQRRHLKARMDAEFAIYQRLKNQFEKEGK